MTLLEMIAALVAFKTENPNSNKADVESYFASISKIPKARSVFVGQDYAFRFSEANTGSFSNVVLSLSALQKYDDSPMVICIVRPNRLDFRLSNSTLLKRISHSSHNLTSENIKGSFLGHDIMDDYEGIPNRPEHFEELSAIHGEFSWKENVDRLVEATNSIVARSTRYEATAEGVARILNAPSRAAAALNSPHFEAAERELTSLVARNQQALLQAASLDNVNIRGNTIEQIITGTVNAHRLDDLVFDLPSGGRLIVDIKTKLLDRASAPKAYNIDKVLSLLSSAETVFAFFFIGLNASEGISRSRLISIFDPTVISATRIQTHWAGRASRGVTQLTGDISRIFDPNYKPSVDVDSGVVLLKSFLER
jgi:hypothetical protein